MCYVTRSTFSTVRVRNEHGSCRKHECSNHSSADPARPLEPGEKAQLLPVDDTYEDTSDSVLGRSTGAPAVPRRSVDLIPPKGSGEPIQAVQAELSYDGVPRTAPDDAHEPISPTYEVPSIVSTSASPGTGDLYETPVGGQSGINVPSPRFRGLCAE